MSECTHYQKVPFTKVLFSILKRYKEVRKSWRLLSSLGLLYVGAMVIEPFFIKFIIDSLTSQLQSGIDYINITLIGAWLIVTLIIMGARALYGTALLNRNSNDWANSMIHDIMEMIRLPLHYHISEQNGEKMKLIDRGSEAVWETGDLFLLEFVPYALLSILLIVGGFFIHIPLTLACISFLPFAFLIARFFGVTAYKNQKAANKLWDKLFGRINDTLTNISLIKILAREKHEKEYISKLYKEANDIQQKIRVYWLRNSSFGRILKIIPRIITLAFAIYLFLKRRNYSWNALFLFFSYADTLYSPIYSIVEKYQQMMQSFAKFEELQKTLALEKEIDAGKKVLKGIGEKISFEKLSFTYPNTTREVLKNINFEIQKGQKIALVGHTGSGKSTIVQLLMRFYKPSEGHIKIDGKDTYDFTLESYRKHFGAVFQDTTLFNESIRHNLEYVRNGITKTMIEEACKKANIWTFIESLPSGLDTEVGERGLKLSGGEKQRLAIARAILADPEVLILDEATSALDTKTERLVQKAFDNLMKGRTSIIIAHRLSTIQHVDCIYLLEKGKIIGQGSHDELYKVSPIYKEMVDLQKDGFLKEKE